MKNCKHYILVIFSWLTLLGICWLIWAIAIDGRLVRKPLDIKTDLMSLTQDIYLRGETVRAYTNFCKNRNIQATIQWHLVDTYLKIFPEKKSNLPVGCRKDLIVEIERIPDDTHPGTYYFEGTATYQINAFNRVTVPLKTKNFIVK